ncbi:MAG TPA: hypothetical protein VE127_06250 [Solirubrobacteraceae bacterium]|nr:hypothetical protein [Solirubrobacteraceae bacterium]
MKRKITMGVIASSAVAFAAGLWATGPGPAARAATALPGMCSGTTTPNLVVNAHANGRPGDVPRFILNVSTDASGTATGAMVLGQGRDRLMVTDWCRVWQHPPGQTSGGNCGELYPPGAITAHAVGLTTSGNPRMLVRADVRKLTDGQMLFRVRSRALTGEGATAMAEDDSCGDEGWTWVPGEEQWAPADQIHIATAG